MNYDPYVGQELGYIEWYVPDPRKPSTFLQEVPAPRCIDLGGGLKGYETCKLGTVVKQLGSGGVSKSIVYLVNSGGKDFLGKVLMGRYYNKDPRKNQKPLGWKNFIANVRRADLQ